MRAKSNLKCRRLYLTVPKSAWEYPDKLRRVKYYDADTDKILVFLSNNFLLPALTIAQLYKQRWQVELFFKWIKYLHSATTETMGTKILTS
ncbi:MAG: transposase [Syntrophobacterales bacterium]|nr:transposase [Syntrophobacterales bacterium]